MKALVRDILGTEYFHVFLPHFNFLHHPTLQKSSSFTTIESLSMVTITTASTIRAIGVVSVLALENLI